MEDCCAVCAEPLEWVGYGPCGHRDVCSVCIARLRFVIGDKQCCICKQECPSVFVTKALGDYTKIIDNFEDLARRRDLWHDSNIQATFDDENHYKMIKNMCRLSCSVCEAAESPAKEFVKKGHVFRDLNQLRRHLLNIHKVHMCGLCLEGRKVFICEQKLYTKKQLDRHLQSGTSEVDLNDEDRGWFRGHPLCNFCHSRFYGDNELYRHMSTEHYTCHICQRLHPGQYDYYNNYDDLEAHFRHDHSLCEHPDCLSKKFVVFSSDAELKRHNALAHGGNMSRAQRNAALQIPVSFQYRRPGQDNRRGSDRPFRRHEAYSDDQQLGDFGSANQTQHVNDDVVHVDSTQDFPHFQISEMYSSVSTLASSIATTEAASSTTVEPSRYLAAVSGAGPSSLRNSAFPPLQSAFPPLSGSEPRQQARGPQVSMASVLGGGGKKRLPQKVKQSQVVRSLSRSSAPQPEDTSEWPQVSASQKHQTENQAVKQLSRVSSEPSINGHLSSSDADGNATLMDGEELRAANKALRESIQAVLEGDDDRYNEFKFISAKFRSGAIDVNTYLQEVKGFGLLHLVPQLAMLCPDAKKKGDLLNVYHRQLVSNQGSESHASSSGSSQDEDGEETKKLVSGKISTLRLTDRGGGSSEGNDVEVLSKDGYRDLKGNKSYYSAANGSNLQNKPAKVLVKAKKTLDVQLFRPADLSLPQVRGGIVTCNVCTLEMPEGSTHCNACGTSLVQDSKTGGSDLLSKDKKKSKKVTKLRMGDGSAALLLDSRSKTWDINGGGGAWANK
ncbi:hypothetical protein KP509_35G041900 [Ceratopteris richardii]|uniref:RING-type E3 ubiquitin transferase n=1 Tax=Ceratopteris richardii TaxID=49495 RepID=A0A8T2QEX9_CERRI|nr:hypothetical protein KP509_35G041900 [Ceratopteris richardii]KAH7282650.1 hypothetical protein KP509_35G041900 [Ceratopteris richardii]KAH7282651.1 hypothetical protein KP509_35G041900 [Ceratopteris richardii]KAH7282652.1 hypothetical protein KP509_35G041900 [Ceratopteris richardii]KAH7282653.1 hypothetical protein KP509_35G041900 [Ceratopteris richardii]